MAADSDGNWTWGATVSASHFQKVSSALAAYTRRHGNRPPDLETLVTTAGISSYRIYTGPWAGRERLFLYFERMNQVEDTWIA